jgi:hypothetical protein
MTDRSSTATDGDHPPAPPVSIDRIPTWARRTIITVLIGGTFLLAVWGTRASDPGAGGNLREAVVSLSPGEGAQAPRQTAVGADLEPGFDGRLTIVSGGQTYSIPEEQMEGARDPATVDPQDLAENGIRPNNRNSVFFRPGPGKVIEEFVQGDVTITVRYFEEGLESAGSESVTWTIRVD